jgi:ATP-dependent exoDNAse (exonuclease V) alpha subunit
MGNKKFCLASGGGGCGKSFAIASWLKNSGLDSTEYVFVAPTGKAVSVAEEKGMHGRTIHSYFKLLNNDTHHNIDRHIISKWGSFDKYTVEMKKELFDKKVIIIDEISMVNNQMLNFILELIQQVAPVQRLFCLVIIISWVQ